MELATGAVRYEFSGPGAYGWFAAFTPDGSAFLASTLFGGTIQSWPTAHKPSKARTPPKPTGTIAVPKGHVLGAVVSPRGHVAVTLADGSVHLRALAGTAPTLGVLPGKGVSRIAFAGGGSQLVAVRKGKAYAWALPAAKPAAQ